MDRMSKEPEVTRSFLALICTISLFCLSVSSSAAQTLPTATCPKPLPNQPSLPEMVACIQEAQSLAQRVEDLERELRPFREAKGAVLAFDRSGAPTADETAGYCPQGWEWFEPSGGRMIIGAGIHQNSDANGVELTRYPSRIEDEEDATGGFETHTLLEDELPAFESSARIASGVPLLSSLETFVANRANTLNDQTGLNSRTPGFRYATGAAVAEGDGKVHATVFRFDEFSRYMKVDFPERGANQPHNNMPPYLALFFCKKL